MRILGIETSCDETACAIVENGTKILSNVVASSAEMHVKTGGIIPEQAARQQVKSIIPVISKALKDAFENPKSEARNSKQYQNTKRSKLQTSKQTKSKKIKNNSLLTTHYSLLITKIDAIAVTYGPGLIGSLLVGVETAKTLSYLWKKPLVPVNHMVGHVYANFVGENSKHQISNHKQYQNPKIKILNKEKARDTLGTHDTLDTPEFPALALVVSGGHTDLVLMKDHPSTNSGRGENIKWIGGTRDDAAGEAFDKSARLLGLPYPGGPSISKQAEKFFHQSLKKFPRPMIDDDSFDFSFSGLKTSVLRYTTEHRTLNTKHLSAEIQEAIVDCLVTKSLRAIKKFKPKSFLLAGGVAANKRLREKFKMEIEKWKLETKLYIPPLNLCTDNAAPVAACAFFNYHPVDWKKVVANPQLEITE